MTLLRWSEGLRREVARQTVEDQDPAAARANGARVRRSGGQFMVSDEGGRAAGYAFLNAGSREEAIALCKQFMDAAGDGEVELRQVMEFAPQPV